MFDGSMIMSFYTLNHSPALLGNLYKNRTYYRTRFNPSMAIQPSSLLVQTDEAGNLLESKKISSSGTAITSCLTPNSLLSQANTIGIIGGASVFSTLIFLEKLVWWCSRGGGECIPFVVCSDPNLKHKRAILEQSGARCIVMPCHMSHMWYGEVSQGCSVPFLNECDCVARELKEAKLKPLAVGSSVRIGVLATDATLMAGFFQEKLESQGFEVVLPDKAMMEHIIIPAFESLHRKDMEGARNLVRIAVQMLLVRAVNVVILASDELQGVLPHNDPLLKKCIDPMDALARSTIKWAKSTEEVRKQT